MRRKKKKRMRRRLRNAGRLPITEWTRKQLKKQEKKRKKQKRKWKPHTLEEIYRLNKKQMVRSISRVIDMTHVFTVVKFTFGYVVECESQDEKDLIETETLFSRDGKTWTLIGRTRCGPTHHDMKWYPRDTIYPVGCKVRL